ncbi:MAG: site-specific integrase, partial [Bordetella sp.]|uniref:site-specific integrase n=1 Tax=Bordetella sp. TaxID=28081 RepID=UPI003F7C2788
MTTEPKASEPAEHTALAAPMQAWLHHLQANRRYARHTLDGYGRDLRHLAELAANAKLPLERIANGHIRQFVARLHAQGLGPRSLARALAAWRGFYQWWAPQAGLPGNPAAGVRAPKAPRGLPKALSVEQTQGQLEHANTQAPPPRADDPAAQRDPARFELFYYSGLRRSE